METTAGLFKRFWTFNKFAFLFFNRPSQNRPNLIWAFSYLSETSLFTGGNILKNNQGLQQGQALRSSNGKYEAKIRNDGTFCVVNYILILFFEL